MKCLLESKDEISVLLVLHLLVFLFHTMFSLLVILFDISGQCFYFLPPESIRKPLVFLCFEGVQKWEHWPETGKRSLPK